ncbi:hypothetical protein HMPREF1051_3057 [Neisseria sicca VK64]|uniref:Uncharacterized protein n=1 Tax=Neisseria sicca VK64 TaxID=1095748 RepID=I2NXA5_NEISI|nr:hypothetical protein HMPREF1051_3057 [Neisseria sicca VK64]
MQNKTIAKLYAIASNNSTKSTYPFVYQAIFNKIRISKKRYPNSNSLLFRCVSIFTANLNRGGTLPTSLLHKRKNRRFVSDKPSKRSSENRFSQFSDDLLSRPPYFGV